MTGAAHPRDTAAEAAIGRRQVDDALAYLGMRDDWPLPPPAPGSWSRPGRDESEAMMRALIAAGLEPRMPIVFDLRMLRPAFAPNLLLVEVLTRAGPVGRSRAVSMVAGVAPGHVFAFDGSPVGVPALCAAGFLAVPDGPAALAWLIFYGQVAASPNGAFHILRSVDDLPAPPPDAATVRLVARVADPPAITPDGDGSFRIEAALLQADVLARAVFTVGRDGAVAMVDNEPVAAGLKVPVCGLREGLRQVLGQVGPA